MTVLERGHGIRVLIRKGAAIRANRLRQTIRFGNLKFRLEL
jgi:hypothetical protein